MRKAEAASPGFPSAKSMRSFFSFMRAASLPRGLAMPTARLSQKRRFPRLRQCGCSDTSSQACLFHETGEGSPLGKPLHWKGFIHSVPGLTGVKQTSLGLDENATSLAREYASTSKEMPSVPREGLR